MRRMRIDHLALSSWTICLACAGVACDSTSGPGQELASLAAAAQAKEPRSLVEAVEELKGAQVRGSASLTTTTCVGPTQIRSLANGLFVSAELGFDEDLYGMLRARSATVDTWEKFLLCSEDLGDTFYLVNVHFGDIVSAEVEYPDEDGGMLRARARAAHEWEQFFIESFGGFATIRSAANGLFVSTEIEYEGDGYAMLRARADVADDWERFD